MKDNHVHNYLLVIILILGENNQIGCTLICAPVPERRFSAHVPKDQLFGSALSGNANGSILMIKVTEAGPGQLFRLTC